MIRKKPEYEYLKIKVPKTSISQIKSISELQNKDFDDALNEIINTGISFKQNNFLLSDRELKIRTLDNMLSQIYPFLYRTYLHEGSICTTVYKLCTFYTDMTVHFVQNPKHENNDIIAMQAHEIFKYAYTNFNSDFKLIKKTIINMPRTKMLEAIFKPFAKNMTKNSTISCNKKGKIVKQTYKKLDGSFETFDTELPPKNNI